MGFGTIVRQAVCLGLSFLCIGAAGLNDDSDSNSATRTGTIILDVRGFRNGDGKARVAVFSNKDGFPSDNEKARFLMIQAIIDSACSVRFLDIPYGNYAVSLFHDENNNGKLDTTWYGLPKEGIGISSNAQSRYGPPSFEDARFALTADSLKLDIQIRYLR